jgi:hypothetical protein
VIKLVYQELNQFLGSGCESYKAAAPRGIAQSCNAGILANAGDASGCRVAISSLSPDQARIGLLRPTTLILHLHVEAADFNIRQPF